MGNLGSIKNMLKRIGAEVEITSSPKAISECKKLILPGVGAFDVAMDKINSSGIGEALNHVRKEGSHILGICLGMQLLTLHSEEGDCEGLGWFNATTVKFNFDGKGLSEDLKIPHMGWNRISINPAFEGKEQVKILQNIPDPKRFYFVHSYRVVASSPDEVLCTTMYGEEFVSGIQKNNTMGVQFHPEKSHKYGMALLTNFLRL